MPAPRPTQDEDAGMDCFTSLGDALQRLISRIADAMLAARTPQP